jgi:hypothetical protein
VESDQHSAESGTPQFLNAEGLLLALYSYWSEEFYAAGFMHPDAETVAEFRRWMKNTPEVVPAREDYEREFLEEFRRQELGE